MPRGKVLYKATAEEISIAIKSYPTVKLILQGLKISRSYFYKMLKEHPELKAQLDRARYLRQSEALKAPEAIGSTVILVRLEPWLKATMVRLAYQDGKTLNDIVVDGLRKQYRSYRLE